MKKFMLGFVTAAVPSGFALLVARNMYKEQTARKQYACAGMDAFIRIHEKLITDSTLERGDILDLFEAEIQFLDAIPVSPWIDEELKDQEDS